MANECTAGLPKTVAAWLVSIIHLLFQNALASSAQLLRAQASSSCGRLSHNSPLASCRALATDQPSHSKASSYLPPSATLFLIHHTLTHPHPLQRLLHLHPSTTPHHTRATTHTTATMQIFVKTRTFTPLHRLLPTSRWRRMLTHSQSRERPSPSRLSPRTLSTM